MKLPLVGGCICGEVRYESAAAPLRMVKCHCRDCQRISGGPFMPIVAVPLETFKITQGAPQHFATVRLKGSPNLRGFCPKCGSQLRVGEDANRGLIGLMASSLDEPAWFKPEMDVFICDAQPWDTMDAAIPKHHEYMAKPTS